MVKVQLTSHMNRHIAAANAAQITWAAEAGDAVTSATGGLNRIRFSSHRN